MDKLIGAILGIFLVVAAMAACFVFTSASRL